MRDALVRKRLEEKVVAALERRDQAQRDFNISLQIPGEIPHSDGLLVIRRSGSEYRTAIADAEKALNDHSYYVLYGTVPAEIQLEFDDPDARQ